MAPKIVDKDEKRLEIARAAIEVFGAKGFDRTRMEDVAREAGVGKGTIYEYFRNKEELMSGAFDALLSGMMEELMPALHPEGSPVETLKAMTYKMLEAVGELEYSYRFFLEYMLHASRRQEGYGELGAMLSGYRQWLADLIDEGKRRGEIRPEIQSYQTAAAFAAWFDGVIFHWIVLPESVSLEQMGERFLEMTLGGLATLPRDGAGGEG